MSGTMLSSIARRRGFALVRSSVQRAARIQRRTLVAPPKPGDGPMMERRADRELPDVIANRFRWSRTLPTFLALIALTSVAIFNYQKSSSPVVSSTMYALRVSPKAREYLGDEIYFAHQIPWISGEMNQLHGRINISFSVRGTRGRGLMRFASRRSTARGLFETTEWSLETEDGRRIDLLDGTDPFRGISVSPELDELLREEDLLLEEDRRESSAAATRGFRQMPK